MRRAKLGEESYAGLGELSERGELSWVRRAKLGEEI